MSDAILPYIPTNDDGAAITIHYVAPNMQCDPGKPGTYTVSGNIILIGLDYMNSYYRIIGPGASLTDTINYTTVTCYATSVTLTNNTNKTRYLSPAIIYYT